MNCNELSKLSCLITLVAVLSACGSSGIEDEANSIVGGTPPPTNRAPSISGSPPNTVVAGETFSFAPTASDPDGDSLTFEIENRPTWISNFNTSTGAMSGTPGSADVGVYQQIVVKVTDGQLSSELSPFSVEVDDATTPPPGNRAPSIGGTPAGSVTVGVPYAFAPSASDPDGDNLSFTIQNQPSWISFNSNTGAISGTPGAGDVGTYDQIIITVTDGSLSDSLPAFSVTVSQAVTGSVTLTWRAPTQNNDESPLTDLTGYAFYYGTSPGNYPNRIQVDDPSITRFVVENLSANTYYFVGVAINSNDIESAYSSEAVQTIQ